jgi:hypothetical protein
MERGMVMRQAGNVAVVAGLSRAGIDFGIATGFGFVALIIGPGV